MQLPSGSWLNDLVEEKSDILRSSLLGKFDGHVPSALQKMHLRVLKNDLLKVIFFQIFGWGKWQNLVE